MIFADFSFLAVTGPDGISAVSYTHLDVYKRQERTPVSNDNLRDNFTFYNIHALSRTYGRSLLLIKDLKTSIREQRETQ